MTDGLINAQEELRKVLRNLLKTGALTTDMRLHSVYLHWIPTSESSKHSGPWDQEIEDQKNGDFLFIEDYHYKHRFSDPGIFETPFFNKVFEFLDRDYDPDHGDMCLDGFIEIHMDDCCCPYRIEREYELLNEEYNLYSEYWQSFLPASFSKVPKDISDLSKRCDVLNLYIAQKEEATDD